MRPADIDHLLARITANEAEALALLIAGTQGELRVLIAGHAASAVMVDQVLHAAWEEAFPRLATAPSGAFNAWFWGIARELLGRVLGERDRVATDSKDPLEHALVRAGMDGLDQEFAARIASLATFKHGVEALEPAMRQLITRRYADRVPLETLAAELGQNEGTVAASLFRARASSRGQLASAEALSVSDPLFPGLIEDYLSGTLIPDARQLLAGSVVKDLDYLAAFETQARCHLLLVAMHAPPALDPARGLADALMPSLRTSQRLRALRRPSDRSPRISDRLTTPSGRHASVAASASGTGRLRRSTSGSQVPPGTGSHRRSTSGSLAAAGPGHRRDDAASGGGSGTVFTVIGVAALALALLGGAMALGGGDTAAPSRTRTGVTGPSPSSAPTAPTVPTTVVAPSRPPAPAPSTIAVGDPPAPTPAPSLSQAGGGAAPRPVLAMPTALIEGGASELVVTAPEALARVEWLVDGEVIAGDHQPPFAASWTPKRSGSARLQARAFDVAGRSGLSEVVLVTVAARPADGNAVVLVEPGDGATFTAPATIELSARTTGAHADRVEFLHGEATLAEDATPPFAASWNRVGAGTYRVRARAHWGDRIETSPAVTVVVAAPASQPPQVRIESPGDFESISDSGKATVRVRATDKDGVVSRVELFADGVRIGEDASAPFAFTWAKPAYGEHILTAVAHDDRGGRAESEPTAVLVGQKTMTTLIRALSFAPERTEIDGWAFMPFADARADGFDPGNGTVVTVAKVPAGELDAGGRAMFARALTSERDPLRFSQVLPDGCYQVHAWVGDPGDGGGSFDLELEGVKVGSLGKLPKAGWAHFGPFDAKVQDGCLNAVATRRAGAPRLSGLAIFGAMRRARPPEPQPGQLWRIWSFGGTIPEFRRLANFPHRPEWEGSSRDLCWFDADDNRASRHQAWFVPTQTGNHQFAIASDDNSELWLSPDETPSRLARIAHVPGALAPDAFEAIKEQQSAPILLVAGRRYFMQVLYQAWGGPNRWNLRVRTPDAMLHSPMPRHLILQPALGGVPDLVALAAEDARARPVAVAAPIATPTSAQAAATAILPSTLSGADEGIVLHIWDGVGFASLAEASERGAFATESHQYRYLAEFSAPRSRGDGYIASAQGVFIPPVAGAYRFILDGDQEVDAWIRPDGGESITIGSKQQKGPIGARTSDPIVLEAGRRYTLSVRMFESSGDDFMRLGWILPDGSTENPIPSARFAGGGTPGLGLKREVWRAIPGSSVDDLIDSGRLGQKPDDVSWVPNAMLAADGDNYGERLSGWIVPPMDGEYSFRMSADDDARLSLDLGGDELMVIAPHVSQPHGAVGSPLRLVAKRRYRIEILHKEALGNDRLQFGWTRPDGQVQDIVPSNCLIPAP